MNHHINCRCVRNFIEVDINGVMTRLKTTMYYDPLCKAYGNPNFGSITSNPSSSSGTTGQRSPVSISAGGYSVWSDTDAIWEMGQSGYSDIVDGDTVTLYDDQHTETRVYVTNNWGTTWVTTFVANFATGLGSINPISSQQITSNIEPTEEDTRPGMNEDIKEELKTKRLRDW